MSSFQSQIRQLRKSTRNRISEASAHIKTEIADEAVLLRARASRISSKAATFSNRALHRISYFGEIPPPPPSEPPGNQQMMAHMESTNPLFGNSANDEWGTPSNVDSTVESPTTKVAPKKMSRGSKRQSSAGSQAMIPMKTSKLSAEFDWLLSKTRNFSWRLSNRDNNMPPTNATEQPTPLNLRGNEKPNKNPLAKKAARPELYAPVPPGFDDADSPSVRVQPPATPIHSASARPTIKMLNAKFETYRQREFMAALKKTPTTAGARVAGMVTAASSTKPSNKSTYSSQQQSISTPSKSENNKPLSTVQQRIQAMNQKTNATNGSNSKLPTAKTNQSNTTTAAPVFGAKSPATSQESVPEMKSASSFPANRFINNNSNKSVAKMGSNKDMKKSASGKEVIAKSTAIPGNNSPVSSVGSSSSVSASEMDVLPKANLEEPPRKIGLKYLNESFERTRQREFLRLKTEHANRVRQRVILCAPFEVIRHREFARVQEETRFAASRPAPRQQQQQQQPQQQRQQQQQQQSWNSFGSSASNSQHGSYKNAFQQQQQYDRYYDQSHQSWSSYGSSNQNHGSYNGFQPEQQHPPHQSWNSFGPSQHQQQQHQSWSSFGSSHSQGSQGGYPPQQQQSNLNNGFWSDDNPSSWSSTGSGEPSYSTSMRADLNPATFWSTDANMSSSGSGREDRSQRHSVEMNNGGSRSNNNNNNNGGASNSRVIKRTSVIKLDSPPNFHEMDTPNHNPLLDIPPPPPLQPMQQPMMQNFAPVSPRSRRPVQDLVIDEIPHDIIPPPQFSPIHNQNGTNPRPKRGSLVSKAFRVISGTFGLGHSDRSSERNGATPPGMAPPAFDFDNYELLQLDMQRAEQQLQFQGYTRLSTVYETRNEYMDSFSSAAAEEFDKERRRANLATL